MQGTNIEQWVSNGEMTVILVMTGDADVTRQSRCKCLQAPLYTLPTSFIFDYVVIVFGENEFTVYIKGTV